MAKYFAELEKILESSELLSAVRRLKQKKTQGKPVSQELKKQLEANRCFASDWSQVRVAEGFDPSHCYDVKFFGACYVGKFDAAPAEAEEGVVLSRGIYNATLINCDVEDNAVICNAGVISNYVIGPEAVVTNTQSVVCTGQTSFGNGEELPIAIETGGREVLTYADMTIPVAEKVAKSRDNKELLAEYEQFIKSYVEAAQSSRGLVEQGARISNCGKVVNTFVGPYAVVDNATKVANATLLSNKEERTKVLDGCWVEKSILQWGCEAASMAIIDSSVCTEHSHVERHGKVTQSILGPNTGVAEGEVTASLCGPFVGFHHQSLLIAALWPEGKGNVGYGANVGSNHTAKAPDQEIWPGEGMFFGLGCNIKFPSDFSRSPYSILATGVTALPQKVEFPFSLVITPDRFHEGISPAYNEILPAWVLSDDIYALKRNEGKYMKRNKARRTSFVFEVLRPDIIDLMLDARERLSSVRTDRLLSVHEIKAVYTEKDIKGLGKNFMKEEARKKAIETYTFYLHYYALCGLKKRVEKILAVDGCEDIENILTKKTEDPRWEHERMILQKDLPAKEVGELLHMLVEYQMRIAKDVQVSKEKDDNRGMRVIPDYGHAHAPAVADSFVKETWEVTKKLKSDVIGLLARLYGSMAKL